MYEFCKYRVVPINSSISLIYEGEKSDLPLNGGLSIQGKVIWLIVVLC